MKFQDMDKIKVIHQGVDTLLISYISNDLDDYTKKYLPFLQILEDLKSKAQDKEGFDNSMRFVKSDLAGFGNFIIYAQGAGSYRYKIQNDDLLIFLSTTKYGANDFKTAQIKVEFRSHFLFSAGHKKAFETVNLFIQKILGNFKTQLLRIDLATDVQGIKYTSLDKHRFQTNFKKVDYTQINEYTKHNRTTGFSIGGGDFLFRIYDKTLEIKQNPSKSFIVSKWISNDYKDKEKLTVFRHEIQLRREYLKKFMPKNFDCEVSFNFSQLDKLWNLAINKVSWVHLTDNEVIRICENELKSASITKIFQRAKKETHRIDFWSILQNWDNKLAESVTKYEYVREAKIQTAYKYVKALVSSTYKALGSNPEFIIDVITDVQMQLSNFENLTLHQHGELKVLGNLVENAKIIDRLGINPINDYSHRVYEKYLAIYDKIRDIKNPIIRSAKNYLDERGLINAS